MMLGTVTLSAGKIRDIAPSVKMAVHEYDWSDECDVTIMGAGPTRFSVVGMCQTEAERLDVIAACNVRAEQQLWFASENDAGEDRYYRVFTTPVRFDPQNASQYPYTFDCIAIVPYIYDADGNRVT